MGRRYTNRKKQNNALVPTAVDGISYRGNNFGCRHCGYCWNDVSCLRLRGVPIRRSEEGFPGGLIRQPLLVVKIHATLFCAEGDVYCATNDAEAYVLDEQYVVLLRLSTAVIIL